MNCPDCSTGLSKVTREVEDKDCTVRQHVCRICDYAWQTNEIDNDAMTARGFRPMVIRYDSRKKYHLEEK
jgi:transcriptional regulator NrdR family protein